MLARCIAQRACSMWHSRMPCQPGLLLRAQVVCTALPENLGVLLLVFCCSVCGFIGLTLYTRLCVTPMTRQLSYKGCVCVTRKHGRGQPRCLLLAVARRRHCSRLAPRAGLISLARSLAEAITWAVGRWVDADVTCERE